MRVLCTLSAALALFASPAAAHEFRGYFDYGRTELSVAGYRMVRSVAAYAESRHPRSIIVEAHMDKAEAAGFSDELSRRRAQAVATELVMLGIDPAVIEQRGKGASAPARITPDDTEEPLNRRVTVSIRF